MVNSFWIPEDIRNLRALCLKHVSKINNDGELQKEKWQESTYDKFCSNKPNIVPKESYLIIGTLKNEHK